MNVVLILAVVAATLILGILFLSFLFYWIVKHDSKSGQAVRKLDANQGFDFWISENGNEITEDSLVKLYEVYYESEQKQIDNFQKYMNIYATLIFALMTVFIGGMLQFYREPFAFALVAIPFFIIIFSEFGKKTIDRIYQRFLEAVVMIAKIENILGLDGSITTEKKIRKKLWERDKTFLVHRWVRDRYEFESSADFISGKRRKGILKYANQMFTTLEIIGVIFTVVSAFILLNIHGFFAY